MSVDDGKGQFKCTDMKDWKDEDDQVEIQLQTGDEVLTIKLF